MYVKVRTKVGCNTKWMMYRIEGVKSCLKAVKESAFLKCGNQRIFQLHNLTLS